MTPPVTTIPGSASQKSLRTKIIQIFRSEAMFRPTKTWPMMEITPPTELSYSGSQILTVTSQTRTFTAAWYLPKTITITFRI
jgi:hypothetical protein